MYHSLTEKPSPLSPANYFDENRARAESVVLFEDSWQVVGAASQVARSGDYLATEVGGIPIVVRNFEGTLVALRNICSHRHSQLVKNGCGHSERLRCPFHGWEFGSDGRTRRIPEPKNFPTLDREKYRLSVFPVAICGNALFVRCAADGPSLREWLGENFDRLESWCSSAHWQLAAQRALPYSANWKIPIEASLESYHIPEIHPVTFGADPGEAGSTHTMNDNCSSFSTLFVPTRWIDKVLKLVEQTVLAILGVGFTGKYEHHHVFPNLLFSHTDSLTLIHSVVPAGSTSSVGCVWQFRRCSVRRNFFSRVVSAVWGWVMAVLAFRVLNEDVRIYPRVQAGVSNAEHAAVLGRCEERILAFHEYIDHRMSERKQGS